MRLRLRALLAGATAVLAVAAPADAATLPAGFSQDVVASGFVAPTAFAFLPDGRILVAEKSGLVKVVKNGQVLATPFLDISSKTNTSNDRGLMGLAADPGFATNGFVYLYYIHEHSPTRPADAKTARLIRVTANGDVGVPASETVILGTRIGAGCAGFPVGSDCIPSDWQGHNGGDIELGADGSIWLAIGDSASPNQVDDRALRAQNLDSLAGKIVHVSPMGAGLPSNPFWNGDAAHSRSKVWAYGVRNPFRFTLRPGSDVPFVGDVGWNATEEVNVAAAGANLGWPCYEGAARQSGYEPKPVCQTLYAQGPSAVTPPLVEYAHALGASVTGGPFYTGTAFPATYQGAYFYGDYTGSWLRYLKVDAANQLTQGPTLFASGLDGPVDIEQGADGALYYLAINTGELRRIRYGAGNGAPTASASATPTSGLAPLDVQFSSAGSSDPNGDPLAYSWSFGDGSPASTAANPTHRYTANGTYTATLTVSDGRGGTGTDSVTISVGNRPPTATILEPASTLLYRIGDTITLRGSATDPDQPSLPDSAYSWRVTLKHCPGSLCHDHPQSSATGPNASFLVEDHGDDVHFEIALTVTDAGGLTDTETVTIHPRTVQLTLASSPPGFRLVYDGTSVTAPFSRQTPAGSTHTIFAPSPQGDAQFLSWSDGGAQQHDVTVGDTAVTYTASFSGSPPVAWDGLITDAGCAACFAGVGGDTLETRIGGGADTVDTAYGWRDLGATSGRLYTRDVLRLANGTSLAADLILLQILDSQNRLVYQLSLNSSRRLVLYSPAGGLRATAISTLLPYTMPNDGSEALIEASALRNDSITVRVDGIDRLTIASLSGATTSDQRYLRAGIIRYGGTSTNDPQTTWHRAVATSTTGWLGVP